MAIYQIFVKLLDGRTQCLQISSPTISGESLKKLIFSKTRIPQAIQRVITGSRIVSDETLISVSSDGFFPSCFLLLRLPGGKGGFGSLLRGAATKAGQKKTNNFDACRDMSGRRLRHVNAEKKLEEWKAEAGDRKLEKLAEQFLKKKAKENKKNSSADVDKYLEKYREVSTKCMVEMEESVRQSFDVYKNLKRKVYPMSDRSSKRFKTWLGKTKVDESCSENDEEDESDDGSRDINEEIEDKSVVLDDGNFLRGAFDGESSGGASDQSLSEHANGSLLDNESSGNTSQQSISEELNEICEVIFQSVDPIRPSFESNDDSVVLKEIELNVLKPELNGQVKHDQSFEFKAQLIEGQPIIMEEPLSFDKYNSATDLEVLGMERLKIELQAKGLKCGGTLQERASRLFFLKTIPFEKLPKKLLAKP